LVADLSIRACRHSFCSRSTAPSYTFTLSLHDALPISDGRLKLQLYEAGQLFKAQEIFNAVSRGVIQMGTISPAYAQDKMSLAGIDRKSTRLNSSHVSISYAVFCLKKKKQKDTANATGW